MELIPTPLANLLIIRPRVFQDTRGYFFEMSQTSRFLKHDLPLFTQTNLSRSSKNTLRGLHYQKPNAQGKLVGVTQGAVFDVAVDIRRSSKTFGQWFGLELTDENHLQLYVPPGFAHGFYVLSESADFYYQCTEEYSPGCEHGIAWNDTDINIQWPTHSPLLSEKDKQYLPLKEIHHDNLFV